MLEISGATDECTEQPQFRRATQNSHRLVLDGVAHQTGRLRFLWRQSTRDQPTRDNQLGTGQMS
jgi:hypothetical protein